MALAYYTGSYYLWVVVEFVFGILHAIILNWKINQVYPWLKTDVRRGKELRKKYPEITQKIKQIFVHKIGGVVYSQSAPLLIYAYSSLQAVAYYGNYTLISEKLGGLLGGVLGSTAASVGNLIAEGNKQRIMSVYWELLDMADSTKGAQISENNPYASLYSSVTFRIIPSEKPNITNINTSLGNKYSSPNHNSMNGGNK